MATAEQFSLRWNNFQSNMTSGFHALWEGEDLVDVTLAADGRFLQAHKVVLSVCSPYFKTLFKVNPCKHPIVILKDVAYKDLEALLQFMYRGEVNVCQEELGGFLKTAEMLEVKGLTGDDSQRSSSPSNQMQQPQALPSKPSKDRTHLSGKLVSASMVLSDDSRSIHSSQFKRKRVSGPVSPATANSVNEENSNTRGHSEYPELAHPKVEPRDMDTDDGGDSYSAEKDASDSLVTLLAGESSHGGIHSEGMDPAVFSSMSAHGQGDSTGTQDASQGFPWMIPPAFTRPKQIKQVWCPVCSRPFATKFNLRIHMRDKHSVSHDLFVCPHCGKVMKNKSCLRVHMYQKHNNGREQQFALNNEAQGTASDHLKGNIEETPEDFSLQD
ncbi:longitudinals lacking protein, isoforms H/M/V-like isoform X3 [Thrips palmi]|uniref:Longitudinals lacking protein, isoforms H/M/V-like isoform X3 n=1 Tax=Thrips palmi TaxID=161013 RepID=A0A6P8Y7V4_THRPL|nr:longitudinals lacking protein, isoforms H/M/V-like isoform X3 [Thrips palmi]